MGEFSRGEQMTKGTKTKCNPASKTKHKQQNKGSHKLAIKDEQSVLTVVAGIAGLLWCIDCHSVVTLAKRDCGKPGTCTINMVRK